MSEIKVATLKNGAQEAQSLVEVIMLSLQHLIQDNPIVFYELVMKCRDRSHQFWGDTGKSLKELNLVGPGADDAIHESICNIVLSATEGDGLDMKLVSPIATPS